MSVDAAVLDRLKAAVDDLGFIDGADAGERYLVEWRDVYRGKAACVLRPASTAEVSSILKIAHETGTPVVPQGGNTGLVGGQIPDETGNEILLSIERLKTIREVDPINNTMTVEAGCVLEEIQRAADDAERFFPLSLAAEGTCQIGGNLSTNAGGTGVLRYGSARDLVLGLEVVLADGRVWNGLTGLRKDNTGYDLKQLFLGAEGTLGVITAAVLKLFPKPRATQTAFVAVAEPRAAIDLLRRAESTSGGAVSAFELVPRLGIDLCLRHLEGARDPLADRYSWYALIELTSGDDGPALRERLEGLLAGALDEGVIADAAIAASEAQRAQFWRLRESLSEVQKKEGASLKHDISVPVSRMAEFIAKAADAVQGTVPGARPLPFGHAGDGNVHFNISQPVDMEAGAFMAKAPLVHAVVHQIALDLGGSISAEHGIGRTKRDELARIKSPVEMDLMRTLKRTLDAKNILNPGKLIAAESRARD